MNSNNTNEINTLPSSNSDFLNYEIALIYEKGAKDIFSLEKNEEEFLNYKKNYNKYFDKCVENLDGLNSIKIEENSAGLEDEIMGKLIQIEKMNENMKSLVLCENKLREEKKVDHSFQDFCIDLKSIKDKAAKTRLRMKTLQIQPVDSTKKMKNDYETGNDSLFNKLRESLMSKVKEQTVLNLNKLEKLKTLEEKECTHKRNSDKVTLKENDLSSLNEKFSEICNTNQVIVEDIQSYGTNMAIVESETKSLEKKIKLKKSTNNSSKNKRNVYVLKFDSIGVYQNENENDKDGFNSLKQISIENSNYTKEIELNQMVLEDYVSLIQTKSEKESLVNFKRCNILSLTGIMMNCLSRKKKLDKTKKRFEDFNLDNSYIENLSGMLVEIRKNESILDQACEKYTSIDDTKGNFLNKRKKREEVLSNFKII